MLKILSDLKLTRLFLLAILLRLLIIPFYFHPDIKTYSYQSSFLKKGVFNIYNYLVENKNSLPIREEFVYFPLTYFLMGTYQIAVSPLLGPNFSSWLSDASSSVVEKVGTFRYLFILKLPYLVVDLIIPFLLIKFFDSDTKRRKAFILWLFNPISIAIIYIFSNIDIFPVALSLISLLLFQKKNFLLSSFILGVAIGFKAYPILFLPFLLLFVNNTRKLILMLSVIIIILAVLIIPFWSDAFVHSALLSSLTTRLIFPGIGIGFGESLMIGIVSLSVLFFSALNVSNEKVNQAWYYLASILLLLFSSIHYHIQWLLWVMPFLILLSVLHSNLTKLVWIWSSLAFLIPLLYDDKSMSISLLSAVSTLYNLLPTPFLIIEHLYDPNLVQGIIHSLMFGIGLVLVWKSLQYKNE